MLKAALDEILLTAEHDASGENSKIKSIRDKLDTDYEGGKQVFLKVLHDLQVMRASAEFVSEESLNAVDYYVSSSEEDTSLLFAIHGLPKDVRGKIQKDTLKEMAFNDSEVRFASMLSDDYQLLMEGLKLRELSIGLSQIQPNESR